MVELSLGIKVGIFAAILVIGYFVLRHLDMDPIISFWESITEMEWNVTALVLTILISAIMWVIMWKTSMWATPETAYRFTTITGVPMKLLISIVLPIIGYPLAVRALTK